MTTKRDVKRIISVLMLLGIIFAAAEYLFETGFIDIKATAAEHEANSTATVASTPTENLTVIENSTASENLTAQVTPTVTENLTATVTPTATETLTPNETLAPNETLSPTLVPNATPSSPDAPAITEFIPSMSVTDIVGASRTFTIIVNQTVDVTWYIDGNPVQSDGSVNTASYTNTSAAQGAWVVSATANNTNGTASQEWTWIVTAPQPDAPAITGFAPESPVSDIQGATRSFNITVNQAVNVTWSINGVHVQQSNESVTVADYTNTSAVFGRWIVNATATNANGTASQEWTWDVKDATPPGNVTNLTAVDENTGQTYINWTWTDPTDPDFAKVMVNLDGVFQTNVTKGIQYYNATGLAPATSHSITVIAFDTLDNIALQPWPENMGTTLPNTPAGSDVLPAGLPSDVTVSFTNVTTEGNTTVSFTQVSPVVPGFVLLGNYADITTSASFTGPVIITLKYPPPSAGFNNDTIRLYHLNNTVWENITTSLDTANNIVTGEVTNLSLFAVGIDPPPKINVTQEPDNLEITVRDSILFDISVDQEANVTWAVNGNIFEGPSLILAGGGSNFTYNSTTRGNYSIIVEASNTNGTASKSWNVTVHPRLFFRGNRIWDGSKPDEFSLTYTWNPMSFPGFYYDINDDVGDESITVTLDSYSDRTISNDKLVYTTTPQEVSFGYSGFGSYEVIGFMAEKYFAGYTSNSNPPDPTISLEAKSVLAQGQLQKVLIDDDNRRTISLGSTLTLQEGYVLKATDIDVSARTMLISLLKDGTEVDSTPLSAGQTYVYTKKVGTISDLPIIMVRFDNVFSGTEVQAAFLQGVFQISESYAAVKSGNKFEKMEVRSVSNDKIEMSNDADISLSPGNTESLMGDVKITVADNSSVVRFALSVEKTGSFEVRSSVYREDDIIDEWTPYNFGLNLNETSIGFYYDLDDGIGTENLQLVEPLDGSRTINDGNLLYTTAPQEVSFGYSGFGSYNVMGFMAEKYFAGYTASSDPPDPTTSLEAKSVLAQGQLQKVLIDDDNRRTISLGSTLTLQEGYVLKATDIDVSARIMLISLLKDGTEVDSTPLSAGQTYVYTKKVGTISDLPIIMVRFDNVFSGTEVQAAFLQGIFQISENYTAANTGNNFGKMEVTSVSENVIEMSNDGSISLDNGDTEELMGNIKLKVGDTTDNSLRFYFAVDVTPEMVANQLVIDSPAQATAGDTISINVTAGGDLIEGVSLAINTSEIGQTNSNGTLNYTLPRNMKGIHNITANKLGYQETTKSIDVLEYIERRLSIDAPTMADQFKTITIKVTSNNTAVSNVTVNYDNTTIGSTDSNGILNYTLETSGTHAISASKDGYITVVREINVRAPFSEYKALDINITPNVVFTDENAVIRSNITNAGTKNDTLPVELLINGTAVDNKSVTLAPGEIKEINFTRKEAKAGNYTVEILGQKGLLEVKERSFFWNLVLIIAVATGLGLITIYILTTKNMISLEVIRRKLNLERLKTLSKLLRR